MRLQILCIDQQSVKMVRDHINNYMYPAKNKRDDDDSDSDDEMNYNLDARTPAQLATGRPPQRQPAQRDSPHSPHSPQ